jgi:hypothetical protein
VSEHRTEAADEDAATTRGGATHELISSLAAEAAEEEADE